MTERRGRALEREITIVAHADAVWNALTDAEELTRWFPQFAQVQPGVGGRLWRAWQSGEEIEERIERWEPNVHLRSVGLTGAWQGIVTDYHLAGQGGTTVLRVVSSGFGDDVDWDALYDAFGGGWDFELRGLRHYLEHHAGIPRVVALARGPRSVSAAEGWSRIAGPSGWLGLSELRADPEPDSRYEARLTTGRRLSGVVLLWQPRPVRRNGRSAQQRISPNRYEVHRRRRNTVDLALDVRPDAASRSRHRARVAGLAQWRLLEPTRVTTMHDILQDFPIAADPARVYRAVSEPAGLDEWWTLRSTGKPSVGAPYELDFGPGYK